jgi:drug/metabolite transporter (DMT)-like permease
VQTKHVAASAVVAVALGSAFLFIRVFVDAGMEPYGVAGARTGVSLVVLTPLMYWKRASIPRDPRVFLALAGIALFNMVLPFIMVPLSQERVSSGTAAIMGSSMPMMTAVLAAFLIADERITGSRAVGLALGFAGVLILMAGGVGEDNATDAVLGITFLLLAVAGYSVAAVFIRRWQQQLSALPLTYIQLFLQRASRFLWLSPREVTRTLRWAWRSGAA